MITSVSGLVERRMAEDRVIHQVAAQTRSTWVCTCGKVNPLPTRPVDWCGGCGHQVHAADLTHGYHPAVTP